MEFNDSHLCFAPVAKGLEEKIPLGDGPVDGRGKLCILKADNLQQGDSTSKVAGIVTFWRDTELLRKLVDQLVS